MNILFWILELATPPLVPLFGFTLMLFLVSCSMGILGPSNLTAVLLLASSSSILLLTIYATGGLIVSHAPWCVWRSLVAMPLYFIWKLGLYFNFAFKGGPKEWVRTSRK
jgi:hypothetical protein